MTGCLEPLFHLSVWTDRYELVRMIQHKAKSETRNFTILYLYSKGFMQSVLPWSASATYSYVMIANVVARDSTRDLTGSRTYSRVFLKPTNG